MGPVPLQKRRAGVAQFPHPLEAGGPPLRGREELPCDLVGGHDPVPSDPDEDVHVPVGDLHPPG
ncbi:unnamed protein product [Acidithrix sp. C25]|nr:unnamed protein product [Acidithrix sp. C25]